MNSVPQPSLKDREPVRTERLFLDIDQWWFFSEFQKGLTTKQGVVLLLISVAVQYHATELPESMRLKYY